MIKAVSPIDGRYEEKTKELQEIFSEYALQKFRLEVEIKYLLFLSRKGITRKFNPKEKKLLENIYLKFGEKDSKEINRIEKTTNHDVKAIEYFIREKLKKNSLKNVESFVHFGLTSEDVNNLANSIQIQKGLGLYITGYFGLLKKAKEIAGKEKRSVMLSHTHGQPASPTTFGKEINVFVQRIEESLNELKKLKLPGKLNSAVGNFNSFYTAFPEKNWIKLSKEFVESFGFENKRVTTQIVPHENISRILNEMALLNNIIVDLDIDLWLYISKEYVSQKKIGKETGSSIMPHKVNPIQFENSEGNLLLANNLLVFLSSRLQKSRLQRDLSDSTIKRNYGTAFGYSLIGIKSCLNGLNRIEPNRKKMLKDLLNHPEVLTESIQTIMRKEGNEKAYEELKNFSRGKKLTLEEIKEFIEKSSLSKKEKNKLLKLKPETYLGKAVELAD
ncbi:adenylosuccinate lyase [Candidatus Micrarchaeota archaeon]|nr:adenylosuccinate lyase [Candidatus Micrarchaeota archaeon]